ncbi:hypothetical protein AKJ37_07875 [candidate division MSBL1 archaeon SCGC-AAA259I09]|uniref:Uncharacterized protein n=1 Tax=candidate division MSBL1 archaeon SCGC-AAA259I09 TaxID=1698267 RepID=A0A133UJ00_9EURY|nr:hypothetical protein AKJ37_07875 [candidate division MSBL1 archaeon SCGC-AAA259I09]
MDWSNVRFRFLYDWIWSVLDILFWKWDKGEMDHSEISGVIYECHKEMQKIHPILNSGNDFLMKLVGAGDEKLQ